MADQSSVFRGSTLKQLLAEAHDYVLKHGVKRESSRGATYSVSALTLVWECPSAAQENHWSWPVDQAAFYQDVFVSNRPENSPERLAQPGDYLFPYTYAARSRFWDGAWGYVQAVLRATQAVNSDPAVFLKGEDAFFTYLADVGELVHLQVLMAVWGWLGKRSMLSFLRDGAAVDALVQQTRTDQLARIIGEIGDNPASRRAVTVSFVYPQLDQRMQPLLGIPPYQFFQLLPGEKHEPLNSFHVHRSLDAGQGVQLDFLHDFHWLAEAAHQTGRPLGTTTITAGDFHVYLPSEKAPAVDRVENWLLAVTDGYQAGRGLPEQLLQKENYLLNARRIYQLLGDER